MRSQRASGILLVAGQEHGDVGVLKRPAACIARSAATITAIPPLSSPAPGPCARLPSRTQRWNGKSGSNTVSRWAMSSSRLPRAASDVASDEMAGAARGLHVDPLRS